MSDRIPATTTLAMALIDYVCARRDCEEILEKLHLEEYIDRELVFDRGQVGDGIVTLKADGRDVFVMDEMGTISNLDRSSEYSFCGPIPETSCKNQVKTMIAALFGKEELKRTVLSSSEEDQARQLREAMKLGSGKTLQEANREEASSTPAPPSGTFIYDRWKGWRLGGEAFFNHYQGPGGGAKFWLGARQDRWEFRANLQGESLQKTEGQEDFALGVTLEPIFHLIEHPLVFDPYLDLPSLGFYRLFAAGDSGISVVPLGGGVQFHLPDAWALYAGARGVVRFGFESKPLVGIEAPLGFSGKF